MREDDSILFADSPADSAADVSHNLCDPFLELLSMTGASITVLGQAEHPSTICASDGVAAQVEELQFELGEGPHWEALRTGVPVSVADVATDSCARWPVFGAAVASGTAARALFSIPLTLGAVTIGVVDLYRCDPGELDPGELAMARRLAGSAAAPALRTAVRSADKEEKTALREVPEMRREVHQATGMLLAQLDTTATDAFMRLRAHAFSSGQPVGDVAHAVVMRVLDFRDLS
jgi:GAF domain-containing protein